MKPAEVSAHALDEATSRRLVSQALASVSSPADAAARTR
ncbi:hypothetical protein L083_7245 [Actinoplanes sp. N902-109]|nr:hypothetical protein L083_7245 [Actinoplanes sp. N902-109]